MKKQTITSRIKAEKQLIFNDQKLQMCILQKNYTVYKIIREKKDTITKMLE